MCGSGIVGGNMSWGKVSKPIQIRAMGELLPLDKDGYIVNQSRNDKIVEPWTSVVEAAKKMYLEHFGHEVHSIYVRGSVARGKAVEGISDVDSFAVLHGGERYFDDSWVEGFQREAKTRYPFCQKVDIELIPYQGLMDLGSVEYLADRLMIKTQSVCILGKDLAPKLVGFKPDKSIAFNAHAINELIEILKEKLGLAENKAEIKDLCIWIMKRFLRAGFEMIMEDDQSYTRDLYLCYKTFSKYYPEREDDARRVLELVLNPVSDKAIILEVVDNFGKWMSREATRKFSL